MKLNLKSVAGAAAMAACLAPGLARAQYVVSTLASGWSQHRYNYGSTGSYLHVVENSTASGTMDSVGTATSAFSQTSGTPPPNGSYTHTPTMDSIYGSADLASATVRTKEFDTASGPSYTEYDGGPAYAKFQDTLTFDVAGATATTQTNILVTFAQTGHLRQSGSYAQGSGESFGVLFIGGNGSISSGARIRSIVQLGKNGTDYLAHSGMDTYPGSYPTFNVVSATPELLVATEVLTITGASITVPIELSLDTNGIGMDIDYLTKVSLGLPTGVTMRSSSGVFATQPVPEPASMTVLGLGALALLKRRKRA